MIKELKERGYKFRVMTLEEANAEVEDQAASVKRQAVQDTSSKRQAPSCKGQASSRKHQAPGSWTLEKVSRTFDRGALLR